MKRWLGSGERDADLGRYDARGMAKDAPQKTPDDELALARKRQKEMKS